MQSHPVPQNIASYEFKLVGDMTLKQFMFLAIGGLLGLAVWKLPIPFAIIRFVMAIVPVGAGILAAFVPLNGRPFTDWVNAFFKAIYAPTQYDYETPVIKVIVEQAVKPVAQKAPVISFANLGATKPVPKTETPAAPPLIIPEATKKIEIIRPSIDPTQTTTAAYISPPPTSTITKPTVNFPENPAPINLPDTPAPVEKPTIAPRFTPIDSKNDVKVVTNPSVLSHTPSPQTPTASTTTAIAPPKEPNILTGLVVDLNQVSLSGATIEIVDSKTGIPTRALRTNQLGQFQIAIPLPPGQYTLNVAKLGLKFAPVSISVNNTIIKPVLIAAVSADTILSSTPIIPNQVTKF